MSATTALRPYQFTAYGRNAVVIQREERGFLTGKEAPGRVFGALLPGPGEHCRRGGGQKSETDPCRTDPEGAFLRARVSGVGGVAG
jgi:hypothetical protein